MATGMLCLFRRKAHTAIKGEVGPSRNLRLPFMRLWSVHGKPLTSRSTKGTSHRSPCVWQLCAATMLDLKMACLRSEKQACSTAWCPAAGTKAKTSENTQGQSW